MTEGEFTFIGFDCAYRTLGWCILDYNPKAFISCARSIIKADKLSREFSSLSRCLRNLFHLRSGGVEDVLGENIAEVDQSERAKKLHAALVKIAPPEVVARSTVIIERQPRKHGRNFVRGAVHDSNQTIESQIVYHFSVVCPAHKVYLVCAGKKNTFARQLLGEEMALTYAERKKQSRRAYVQLAAMFDFRAHPRASEFRHVKADRADACVQIIAAIFLCAKYI